MMTVQETEIVQRFRALDAVSRARVLSALLLESAAGFDAAAWWRDVESLQAGMRARLGPDETIGGLTLLEQLREESP